MAVNLQKHVRLPLSSEISIFHTDVDLPICTAVAFPYTNPLFTDPR
jgi:hypothetical protein